MAIQRGPEVWESATEELRLRRTVESLAGNEYLVELVFQNRTDSDVVGRILEDLPLTVSDATLVVAPGGDPDSWRQFGEWIVHEPRVPANAERTVAYVLESDGDSELRLPPPRVRSVKPAGESSNRDVSTATETTMATAGGTTLPETTANPGIGPEESTSTHPDLVESAYGEALLDQLLAALEDDELDERRRAVQSKLGVPPSERARFEYLKSRLDDLGAYIDALEGLVDDHGVDVVAELRASVERNEERTDDVEQALEDVEEALERYRADTDHEIASIRSYLTDLDDELDDRCCTLEKQIDRLGRDVETARQSRRGDRHAMARDRREFERSLSSLSESLTALEDDVREMEEFREKFAAVCTPETPSASNR